MSIFAERMLDPGSSAWNIIWIALAIVLGWLVADWTKNRTRGGR